MNEPCPPLRDLLALYAGSGEGRWRDHARTCPRCRSRLAAYGLFAALAEDAPCPGEEQATTRVAQALHGLMPLRERPRFPGGKPFRDLFIRWWRRRWLVPAFGAAAIATGVFLMVRDELRWPAVEPSVREAPSGSPETTVTVLPPFRRADGAVEIRWKTVSAADAYRFRVLDSGLQEIAGHEIRTDTFLVLPEADVRAWVARGAYWQVRAYSGGDRIAESRPEGLP